MFGYDHVLSRILFVVQTARDFFDDVRRARDERISNAAIFCPGCYASCCQKYSSPQYLESWLYCRLDGCLLHDW